MKELTLLTLMSLTFAIVVINTEMRCVCSDIEKEDVCLGFSHPDEDCVWVDNKCRARTCAETPENICDVDQHYNCKWDKTCKDYIVVCSDFTTQRGCDDIPDKYNCVWNNNTCIPFTKCSDYELGYEFDTCRHIISIQQCRENHTSKTCENKPQDNCSCSDNPESNCSWCYDHPCYFDTTCKKVTNCRQINSTRSCLDTIGCQFGEHCQNSECSYFTSEQSCNSLDNYCKKSCNNLDNYGEILYERYLKFLCKWDTESQKCTEIAKITELDSEEKCYHRTQNNFYWDGIQCNQCASVAASINYTKPDSDPIPETPKSDQIVKMDFKNFCPCQGFYEQYKCNSEIICKWENNQCKLKKCPEYSESDCKTYSWLCQWDNNTCNDIIGGNCGLYIDSWACNSHSISQNCVWENDKCVPFTKCIDYVPGIYGCSSKSAKFQACQNNADGTTCEDAEKDTVTCNTYLTSDICIFTYNTECIWGTTCQDLTSCSQIESELMCLSYKYYCTYDTSCRDRVCSDFQSRSTCVYVLALGYLAEAPKKYSGGTLCRWNPTYGMCVEATDTSYLTFDKECAFDTLYTHYWDGTKCTQCTNISSRDSSDVAIRIMIYILVYFI